MGTVVGLVVLISGYVLKNQVVKQTALGIFIFSCFGILGAHFTGEGAEEIVEKLPDVNHKLIHRHEDLASIFGWSLLAVALLSLLTLYLDIKNKNGSKILYLLILAASILTIGFAKQTATSGGEVRHTEIRDASAGQMPNSGGNNEVEGEHEH
jgi:hypothetical protein